MVTLDMASIKQLQLVSAVIDNLIDLVSKGADCRSDLIENLLLELIRSAEFVLTQIRECKNDYTAKD